MTADAPDTSRISIRLARDPADPDAWFLVFRNDGPPLADVELYVAEGGIPCPGDLGSTLLQSRRLDGLGRFEEYRFGPHRFVPGGEDLDMPLAASLTSGGRELMSLAVRVGDLGRLGSLRGSAAPSPPDSPITCWRRLRLLRAREEAQRQAPRRPWWRFW